MNLKELIQKRYATKKFDGKTIPQEKMDELLDAIRLAPSSFNIQPWVLKIITDATTKEKLSPHCWNQPQITSCSHLIIFCVNTNIDHLIKQLDELLDIPAENKAQYLGMISGFASNLSEEELKAWLSRQLYIALAHGMLAAKDLGFDSCPMEGFMPEKIKQELNLPEHIYPVVLLPVGYANDTPHTKVRHAIEDIVQ